MEDPSLCLVRMTRTSFFFLLYLCTSDLEDRFFQRDLYIPGEGSSGKLRGYNEDILSSGHYNE